MKPDELFIRGDRLRPFWRFLISLILLYGALVLASELVGAAFSIGKFHRSLWMAAFWYSLVGLLAVLAACKVLTAVFEGRPLGSMGLAFHRRWWRELNRGLAVGAAMIFLAVGLEWSCGLIHFTFTPHSMWRAGLFDLALFTLAATNEEAIFRGYAFQRLVESITPAGAIALSSVIFGLVHFANPHRTWISTVNTALVGIPFSIAYLRTRALWMPIGMHMVWNFLQGFFLGLPVSGMTVEPSVLTARVQGPDWLTGGSYGPEGGVVTIVAILAAIVYLLRAKSIYTGEEMKALVSAPVVSSWPERPVTIFSAPPKE